RTLQFQFAHVDEKGMLLNKILGVRSAAPQLGYRLSIVAAQGAKPYATTRRDQPFIATPIPSISADGQSVIAIQSQELPGGLSSSGAITLTSAGLRGDTLWSKRLTYKPNIITDAHVRQMIDSFAKPIIARGAMRLAGDRKMIADSLIRPPTWPAVTALLTGLDGTIWLKPGAPTTGADSYWWRLSPTGVFETLVRVPSGLNLMQASRNRLWGWRPDENDVPVIERYRY
ncbi:MAG: hypothetical protein ABI852_15920, partial [Gemmatimonadaceae bacterium]